MMTEKERKFRELNIILAENYMRLKLTPTEFLEFLQRCFTAAHVALKSIAKEEKNK